MAVVSEVKNDTQAEVERESFEVLEARLLKGAAERIRADIEEGRRLGIFAKHGNLLSDELPEDMRPGAQRDFGG